MTQKKEKDEIIDATGNRKAAAVGMFRGWKDLVSYFILLTLIQFLFKLAIPTKDERM